MLTKLLAALLVMLAAAQTPATLRIRVMLPDGTGAPIALPRVVLLVSDNPATAEPRRVRTDTNGAVALTLAPGSYTVESDRPVAFGGKAYSWTQIVNVVPGKDTMLDLTARNAEVAEAVPDAAIADAPAAVELSSAVLLSKWHDSVVEVWTPTRHAQGFVIDSRGLIATSHRALNGATTVEVEIRTRADHFKVPGQVIMSDRLTGAAVIWIDPQAIASIAPVDLRCGTAPAAARYQDTIATIAAPM